MVIIWSLSKEERSEYHSAQLLSYCLSFNSYTEKNGFLLFLKLIKYNHTSGMLPLSCTPPGTPLLGCFDHSFILLKSLAKYSHLRERTFMATLSKIPASVTICSVLTLLSFIVLNTIWYIEIFSASLMACYLFILLQYKFFSTGFYLFHLQI